MTRCALNIGGLTAGELTVMALCLVDGGVLDWQRYRTRFNAMQLPSRLAISLTHYRAATTHVWMEGMLGGRRWRLGPTMRWDEAIRRSIRRRVFDAPGASGTSQVSLGQ